MICMYVDCVCVCVCLFMHACACVCVHKQVRVYVYMCTCVHVCACLYKFMHDDHVCAQVFLLSSSAEADTVYSPVSEY